MSQEESSALAGGGRCDESLTVYTIGHGRHELQDFLQLLALHGVEAVVDVRSQPHSRWAPQFNRESIASALTAAGLTYHYLGDSLGGRPTDAALYPNGAAGRDAGERPDYDRIAASPEYAAGIETLLALARETRLAIMCSEGDYRQCHRHLLLAPSLAGGGACVLHIRPDGSIAPEGSEPQQLSLFS